MHGQNGFLVPGKRFMETEIVSEHPGGKAKQPFERVGIRTVGKARAIASPAPDRRAVLLTALLIIFSLLIHNCADGPENRVPNAAAAVDPLRIAPGSSDTLWIFN
jgi:hypothetical protein